MICIFPRGGGEVILENTADYIVSVGSNSNWDWTVYNSGRVDLYGNFYLTGDASSQIQKEFAYPVSLDFSKDIRLVASPYRGYWGHRKPVWCTINNNKLQITVYGDTSTTYDYQVCVMARAYIA